MLFDKNAILKANSLVRKFDTTNPVKIAQGLGIHIIYRDCENIKGMYAYMLRNRFIVIDSKLSEMETKIVAAHELGHDQNDRYSYFGAYMDRQYLSHLTHEREITANYFSAELLIQDDDFFDMLESGYTFEQMALELDVFPELVSLKADILKRNGHKICNFDIGSKDFLKKRLDI